MVAEKEGRFEFLWQQRMKGSLFYPKLVRRTAATQAATAEILRRVRRSRGRRVAAEAAVAQTGANV